MADNNAENNEIRIGSKAHENVVCAQCSKQVLGNQAYAYKDKNNNSVFLCESCRAEAEKALQEETKSPNIAMAIISGVVAATIAGVAWSLFSVLTGYQIGYIAIGVGFLIGWAVIFGSGKKRGPALQLISAAITLITLLVSQYFMVLYYYRKYLLEHKAEFPDYNGEWFFVSPLNPDVLKDMFSPMGLVIWGIGIYFAYSLPKSRNI